MIYRLVFVVYLWTTLRTAIDHDANNDDREIFYEFQKFSSESWMNLVEGFERPPNLCKV